MARTSKKAKLMLEAGQQAVLNETLTTNDNITYSATNLLFSRASGREIDVKVSGILTGAEITSTSTVNEVSVAAFTANVLGQTISVNTSNKTITRATTDTHVINSIIYNATNSQVEVLAGIEGTSFVETRGAAGGPAYIPDDGSIEIGQVRVSSQTSAVISSNEIFQVDNIHKELANDVYSVDYFAGQLIFSSAIPAIHTGDVGKKIVLAQYYTPIFTELPNCAAHKACENTYSTTSTPVYNGSLGSTSESLNAGSFTYYGDDLINDLVVKASGDFRFVKFYPDRNRTPYILSQGIISVDRTWAEDGNNQVDCTVNPEQKSVGFEA